MYEGLWATRLAPFTGQPSEWTATLDNPPQCPWNKGPTADPRDREREGWRGGRSGTREWFPTSKGPRQHADIHDLSSQKQKTWETEISPRVPSLLRLFPAPPSLIIPLSPACCRSLSQGDLKYQYPFSPWHCFLLAVSILLSFYSQNVRRNTVLEYS